MTSAAGPAHHAVPETQQVDEVLTQSATAIRRASVTAAGLAVLFSPVPLADEVLLLPVYGWLTVRLARVHHVPMTDVPWRALAKLASVGLAVRGSVNVTVATMPGIAAAVNAATAVGLTQAYGALASRAVRDPTLAKIATSDLVTHFWDHLRGSSKKSA